ncbi:MAG: xanthine dehydrogenase family protein molybdopterin-binding subunit [Actinomycetota bacterium]|nr:xanthine dehydrogenase family protein molybdopterin-binding subunit [Actinomycetota bacterium]
MDAPVVGGAVPRAEDERFITGAARYTEDLPADGALHAVFVRAYAAHARILGIDTEEAARMPGVAGVSTAADLGLEPMWRSKKVPEGMWRPVLAADTVRFAGEPVAVVIAETRAQAMDAAELVAVDYEPLPVVIDPTEAVRSEAPALFPDHGTNVAMTLEGGEEGALDGAEVVVRARFVNQRVAPAPMEGNAILAIPQADGGLTVWVSTQAPFWLREELAPAVGLDKERIRVIAPAVGGAFGAKIYSCAEHVVAAALALRLRRPIRWVETRSESMVTMTHGRGQVQDVGLAARRDGTLTGIRVRVVADCGAYPGANDEIVTGTRLMATGPYRIPRVDFRADLVVTNTTPVSAYRGAGRPEATALLERAMDMLAVELDLDPAVLRRRNLLRPEQFPYTTPAGATYDTGSYQEALDQALRLAGYEELRKEQAERRERDDRVQLGVGMASYVEVTASDSAPVSEYGSVEVHPDGTVTVATGISPHGQGHETSLAQIAAETLRVPFDRIQVVHSDTGLLPRGEGTWGSRSLQMAGPAVLTASQEVVEKARRIAAHLLEVNVEDVVHADGRIGIVGAPERSLSWGEIATAAADGASLPQGMEPGCAAYGDVEQGGGTFPFGTHVAVVEVDMETGGVRLRRHVAVDDAGRILNPLLADGQVHGGLAQGIAQALFEEILYDEDGNPLTANLMAYAVPSAAELPMFETAHTETPTPLNPLGAKGIGEAATIGSTPAVQNAVIDALSHLGVRHLDLPLTSERVWRAIRGANANH